MLSGGGGGQTTSLTPGVRSESKSWWDQAIHHYLDCCRIGSPDSGTEHIVCDAPDIVDVFLQGEQAEEVLAAVSGFLSPKLFFIPEINHSWDLILGTMLWSVPWFPAHFDSLKELVTSIRSDSNRKVMQESLKSQGLPDVVPQLDKAPEAPFKLRWGTVHRSSVDVEKCSEAVGASLTPAVFPRAGKEFQNAHRAASNASFYIKNSQVIKLTGLVEKERRWSMGCPCHEAECQHAARTGVPFICPRNRKGMRLPELRRRLINARLQWRQFQKDNIVAVEKDPTGEITAGSHSAVSNLIAMSLTRFHYVENGPATLSEARDRDRCIAILKRYEREVGDALEQHRVLDWWCSEETSLGKALHQYAALGIMDTELDNELTALESAILDGTSGEAVHGLLQRISTVAIGASFRYKASGVRLPQNTDEHALYLKMGLAERFENCWRNHKSVLATSARGIRTLRPVREPMKTFVQGVYRYGVVALQDWSVVGKLLGNKKGTAQPCDSEACRVKVDFVKTLVRSSNIYSCSSGVMPIADTPEGEPATEAIVPYGDALCAFEVLDVRPYSRIIAGNKHAVPMFFRV